MNMDGPGFPRVALGLAWLGAAVATAVVAGYATAGRAVVIAAVLTVAGLITGRMTRRARLMVEG